MKTSIALALIVPIALVLGAPGCAQINAMSGDASACSDAQKQLGLARASLVVAQLAVTTAGAFGSSSAVALAQTAVTTITTDVAAIQTLVTQSCTVAGPATPTMAARQGALITLTQARRLALADQALANAAKLRASAAHGG